MVVSDENALDVRDDRLLTPEEVAARLGSAVSVQRIRRWIAAGKAPGAVVTPSGRYLVPASALDHLLRPIPGVA